VTVALDSQELFDLVAIAGRASHPWLRIHLLLVIERRNIHRTKTGVFGFHRDLFSNSKALTIKREKDANHCG